MKNPSSSFAVFVLFMCSIVVINAMEQYDIPGISTCYGDTKVKVRASNDDFSYNIIPNCYKVDGKIMNDGYMLWNCKCINNSLNIIIETESEDNEYDVVIEYYIETPLEVPDKGNRTKPMKEEIENDLRRRTVNYNNINKKEVVKEPIKLPPFSGGIMILSIVLSILLLVIGVSIFVAKKLLKDKNNKIKGVD